MRARFHVFIIIALLLGGCGPKGSKSSPVVGSDTFTGTVAKNASPAFKPGGGSVPLDWTPERIQVGCGAEDCPLQVGLLIFAGQPVNGKIPTRQCTAFLISGDTVMSNAHCDSFGQAKGYFVSQKIKGKREIREIVGVPFKRYTPHPSDPEAASGRPDVAVFQLSREIGIPGLPLASGTQHLFKSLAVYAIKRGSGENQYSVRRYDCEVRRHEVEFPFDIAEGPDMIQGFGCRVESGMSGSPMFAQDSGEVQAVLVGGINPDKSAERVREKHKRELFNYEKHWSAMATNVRCLDLPGARPSPCTVVDAQESARRFDDVRRAEMQKLNSRRISKKNDLVQLRPTKYQLSPVESMRFEVIHWPECRRSADLLHTAPFIIEQVEIELDEWATPKIKSLSQVPLAAEVKLTGKDVHEVEINWPAPAAPYLQPELDLRTKWGRRFGVDIPLCPR